VIEQPATPLWTILIADDDAFVRRLVQITIASSQYLVLEAPDGDSAWEILQTVRPDVLLLDVQMPGRDGFELTRAIKADPLLASTPVILLTGTTSRLPSRAVGQRAQSTTSSSRSPPWPWCAC
jgi:CheY-like chemotaxis protein